MERGSRRLIWVGASFLLVSIFTRIGLAIYSGENFSLAEWASFLGVGLIFDLVVLPCFLVPWALYDTIVPKFVTSHNIWGLWEARWAALWGVAYLTFFVVIAVSEFTFWTEFSNRFDFIAVDYLVYTHEVIRNIWQSYPVVMWVIGVSVFCFGAAWFSWPRGDISERSGWKFRGGRAVVVGVIATVGLALTSQNLAKINPNLFVQQLSTNGLFALFHAYRHNELDYDRYYPKLETASLNKEIRALVKQTNTEFTGKNGIDRLVRARHPLRKVNIVFVSIESLSASFMSVFGNKEDLTPELEKLADQGLFFTNLYATGTRTVCGLEAMSVGTPPTPGQSIVRRPDSGDLITIGGELKAKGWTPYWIYGGYGMFDNMNAYFRSNHYKVVDRSDIEAEGLPIHQETVWGVADEDLYSLALANIDREHVKGNRFFALIMTTSNHRPYTFPEGRIDMPQKRRESVVKYTDWAIGDFVKRSSKKPWFKNTLFIFVSDHTHSAAGKTNLPPSRYHIPMVWYAPGMIEPAKMTRLMSQIDIGPTLMGWLGMEYQSGFFGYDMHNLEPGRERAFISTYQKLGYLKHGRSVVLDVNRKPIIQKGLPEAGQGPRASTDAQLINEAIAWYQSASLYYSTGRLKDPDAGK